MNTTILLVDDHTSVRHSLRQLLEAQPDIEVIGEADNGHQAVLRATQLDPDVVIMDISMPGPDGIDATHQVLQQCPNTQIIILSMLASVEHVLRALQVGALGYLLKESTGFEIVAAIRAVRSGHHYISQKLSDEKVWTLVRQDGGPILQRQPTPGLTNASAVT